MCVGYAMAKTIAAMAVMKRIAQQRPDVIRCNRDAVTVRLIVAMSKRVWTMRGSYAMDIPIVRTVPMRRVNVRLCVLFQSIASTNAIDGQPDRCVVVGPVIVWPAMGDAVRM